MALSALLLNAAINISNTMQTPNVDADEIEKFNALAHRWWDPDGDFKALHDINPARLAYIEERTDFNAGPVADIGCGGGILAEAMARRGADVTGLDMAGKALSVARLHAAESAIPVAYETGTPEQLAEQKPEHYRTVTCMEMLEHVSNYASTVRACANLAQPGGDLFFSTINRNPKAYVLLVLGAEYVLGLLPRGTHDYEKFIRPAELCQALRDAGLDVEAVTGMRYNPFTRACTLGRDVDANYLVHAKKPAL
jgi:2-polyprenyl-6-hydroxyphenyl methylase/3-demethylubiquinone-9 3-methyltransferase